MSPAPRSRHPAAGPSPEGRPLLAQHSVARALDASASLAGLLARIRESDARLAAIRPALPEALAGTLRAGPLDERAWVLLADHAAAAAKLRHWLPQIEAMLQAAGWAGPKVIVKVRRRA
jgi:hypothetical protein